MHISHLFGDQSYPQRLVHRYRPRHHQPKILHLQFQIHHLRFWCSIFSSSPPLQMLLHFSTLHDMSFFIQLDNNLQKFLFFGTFPSTFGKVLGRFFLLLLCLCGYLKMGEVNTMCTAHSNITIIKLISTLDNHNTGWVCF